MSVIRDISLILLALEGAIFTLVVVAVLAMVNYGLFRFRWWHTIPRYFALAWEYLVLGRQIVERICRAVVAPIFAIARVQGTLAGVMRGLLRADGETDDS